MRITQIELEGYRSLRKIEMDNLGSLVILIGRNGSGKSNILETLELFFTDLDLLTNTSKSFPPVTWYDKRTTLPIVFVVTIELDKTSLEKIFTDEVLSKMGLDSIEKLDKVLTIHREIEVNMWKNIEVKLGEKISVKEGKAKFTSESGESELSPEVTNLILTNMNNILKNSFKLIRSPRESAERPPPTTRPSIIDPESRSYLTNLAVNPKDREEEMRWIDFERQFRNITDKDVRTRGSTLEFRVSDLSLPIELSGSGDQALMILMRQFFDQRSFYGIEEPETRFHHDYQRKVFRYLKLISNTNQILISTHSSVFVDKAFLNDSWFVSLEGKETKVKRLESEDLKKVLLELGVMPSDFFLANRILLVEGFTERSLLPLISEKVGIDISNVSIIPIHGKSKGKYHLQVWMDATKNTNLPIYLLLDKDAEKDVKKLEKANLIDRDYYYLLKGDFEDYYPKDILEEVIKELTSKNVGEESTISAPEGREKSKIETTFKGTEPVVDKINNILGRKDWKIEVGLKVINKATSEQIRREMDEIIRFLKKLV